MTYEEYLNAPEIAEHTEWVNGRVVPMMSVSKKHAQLTVYLTRLIGNYSEALELGAVFADPFNMKLGSGMTGRAPDVMFVQRDRLALVGEQFLDGPADLVIEVISRPGTERIDRVEKFAEYQQGGVREYWILDPHHEVAEFFVLDDKGRYHSVATADGVFASTVVEGITLRVEWFWTRPRIDKILLELGLGR